MLFMFHTIVDSGDAGRPSGPTAIDAELTVLTARVNIAPAVAVAVQRGPLATDLAELPLFRTRQMLNHISRLLRIWVRSRRLGEKP